MALVDDVVRIHEDNTCEYYEPGVGWVANHHYYDQIFYAGDGAPVTEAEAFEMIATQEAELVAA